MYRKFEELGVDVAGGTYGHFTGEAEWDRGGQVVAIELETSGSDGKPLTLNIEDLVRERIALRRQYGTVFLENHDPAVVAHARKWFLFQGLSDALQDVFAEDVEDDLAAIRADASARRRSGVA